MAGITETKNRLPNEFVNNLYEMFTPGWQIIFQRNSGKATNYAKSKYSKI